jgi:hypothetical protein
MRSARTLPSDPRAFDALVAALMGALLLGAYITAYAYVIEPNRIEPVAGVGYGIVLAAWLGATGLLFAAFAAGLRAGRPWDRALPDGYTGSLAAALIFGAAWIVDNGYWQNDILGANAVGLDALFTPPRLIEMAAAAVMVSGPLRSAARRGETTAGVVTLLSASLLISVLTFALQFIHPLIDPWASKAYAVPAGTPEWVGKNVGVAALLAQSLILAGAGLLLNSGFKLRPGSLTFVFTVHGALATITKLHFSYLPVLMAAGIAGDVWIAWSARRPGRPSASLCAVIGGAFAAAYMGRVVLFDGTVWAASLWSGTILAATMLCWLMGRLLRAGLPAAIVAPLVPASAAAVEAQTEARNEIRSEIRWTRDPASTVRPQLVRAALDDLGTPEALGRSPLGRLPGVSREGISTAADLRAVLVDVISELATSSQPRDAEAGRLLLDYYVKKVGSHEVIMERLHLSRPTFYRRLQRGFQLVAERLDEMSEFAGSVPVA